MDYIEYVNYTKYIAYMYPCIDKHGLFKYNMIFNSKTMDGSIDYIEYANYTDYIEYVNISINIAITNSV